MRNIFPQFRLVTVYFLSSLNLFSFFVLIFCFILLSFNNFFLLFLKLSSHLANIFFIASIFLFFHLFSPNIIRVFHCILYTLFFPFLLFFSLTDVICSVSLFRSNHFLSITICSTHSQFCPPYSPLFFPV